jgi:hypothetical protein
MLSTTTAVATVIPKEVTKMAARRASARLSRVKSQMPVSASNRSAANNPKKPFDWSVAAGAHVLLIVAGAAFGVVGRVKLEPGIPTSSSHLDRRPLLGSVAFQYAVPDRAEALLSSMA